MNAINFVRNSNHKFDVIFFDFCGSPKEDINDISKHITPGGFFAITEFYGRKCRKFPFNPFQYFESASFRMRYKHMRFKLYKRNAEPYKSQRVTYTQIKKLSSNLKAQKYPQPSPKESKREEIREVRKKLEELSESITDIDINSLRMHFDDLMVEIFLTVIKTVSFSATTRIIMEKETLKETLNYIKVMNYWKTMKDNLEEAVKIGLIYMDKFCTIMNYVDTIIYSKDLRSHIQVKGECTYDVDTPYVQLC
jgi:hypothetical protein